MEVFNLNIRPGKTCPVIHCSQFDKGRAFRANLYDGSEVFTLTAAETLSVIEKKSDGNMVTIGVTNTSDSYVEFATTEQMTALAGPQICELRIVEGDTLIGSANFILDCEESPDTGIESESEIHNLETQIQDINNEIVPDLVAEEVANQYDSQNVIFDDHPTEGHGRGYAVTSEGVKNALVSIGTFEDVAVASFSDGADDVPVSELIFDIEARQEGSGTPSPDNVRAIHGFNSGVITRCGVNLWDEDYALGFWRDNGEFLSNTIGYMSSKTHIPVKPNESICVVIPNNISFYICRYDKNKNFIDRLTLSNPSQRIVQMTSETFYITFSTYQAYGTTYNNDISINYPSTDTQYHAYNGNTYTVDFGQTVYGGFFDNRGNLVVTHGYITLDGSFDYTPNGATTETSTFIVNISGKAYGRNNFISDKFIVSDSLVVGHADGRRHLLILHFVYLRQ